MKNDNLTLNIDTTKRNAKRLHKVLKEHINITLSENFKLTHTQEILSKALGFNNWYELHRTFTENNVIENTNINHHYFDNLKLHLIQKFNLTNKHRFVFYEGFKEEGAEKKFYQEYISLNNFDNNILFFIIMVSKESEFLKSFLNNNLYLSFKANYGPEYKIKLVNYEPHILDIITHTVEDIFEKAYQSQNAEEFNFYNYNQNKNNDIKYCLDYGSYNFRKHFKNGLGSTLDMYELSTIIIKLTSEKSRFLIESVMPALFYMQDEYQEIIIDPDGIKEHLTLDIIAMIFRIRKDFPYSVRAKLRDYLVSLPGYEDKIKVQNEHVYDEHVKNQDTLLNTLNYLSLIDREDVLIFNPKWFEFLLSNNQDSLNLFYKNYPGYEIKVARENYFLQSQYVSELWFSIFNIYKIDNHDRNFAHLFKKDKNIFMSDLLKTLFHLNVTKSECDIIKKFVFSYPHIKKISEELQNIYLKNKEY